MDRFEGRCWLDWWANSVTNLAGDEVDVVITATGAGWEARGRLVDDSDDAREGLALLCEFDPAFTLRFAGGGTVAVIVHPEDGGSFTLTEDQ